MICLDPTSYDSKKYTFDGLPDAESRIARDQALVIEAVRGAVPEDFLEAIVLIGGYGRGDGGYTLVDGAAPFNDYDYFLVFDGVSAEQAREFVSKIDCHQLEQQVGVEVDFFPLRKETLPTLEFSLMYAEMRQGHRVVYGNKQVLDEMKPMPLSGVSDSEFARLLMNRGFLLLLNYSAPEAEKFNVYINKAVLAAGDAVLHYHHQYHISYREKLGRLKKIMPASKLTNFYEKAVVAKYRPDLAQQYGRPELIEVTQLWLTARQLIVGQPSGLSLSLFKNIVLNLSYSPLRYRWQYWLQHPRVYLSNWLSSLLASYCANEPADETGQIIPLWHRFS